LIKENFALTAAQLVTDANNAPVKHIRLRYVHIGTDTIEMKPCKLCNKRHGIGGCACSEFDERGILTIPKNFAHRNFPQQGYGYDIALIKFPANQRFIRENVDIIAFSKKTPQQLIGTQFFASGWGHTESSQGLDLKKPYVDDLKVTQMEFVYPDTVTVLRIVPSVLAASQVDMKSTCIGDIGGKVVFTHTRNSPK